MFCGSQTVDKGPNCQNIVMLSPFVILRNAVTKNLFSFDTARILRFRSGWHGRKPDFNIDIYTLSWHPSRKACWASILTYCATHTLPYLCTPTSVSCLSLEPFSTVWQRAENRFSTRWRAGLFRRPARFFCKFLLEIMHRNSQRKIALQKKF